MSGTIVTIWLKRMKRGPMDRVESAELIAGRGLRGNADQGGRRQITLLAEESWDRAQEALGVELDPSARRANVLLRGLDLETSRGRLLRLGETTIRIHGYVRPCERLNAAQAGLRAALIQAGGGVFGEIIEGGTIRTGDSAKFIVEETCSNLSLFTLDS